VKPRGRSVAVFGGTAGAVFVAAAVARVACPGGCGTCETCVSSIAPLGAGLITTAGVVVATAPRKRRRHKLEQAERDAGAERGGPQE
jgi:hypothetical protein